MSNSSPSYIPSIFASVFTNINSFLPRIDQTPAVNARWNILDYLYFPIKPRPQLGLLQLWPDQTAGIYLTCWSNCVLPEMRCWIIFQSDCVSVLWLKFKYNYLQYKEFGFTYHQSTISFFSHRASYAIFSKGSPRSLLARQTLLSNIPLPPPPPPSQQQMLSWLLNTTSASAVSQQWADLLSFRSRITGFPRKTHITLQEQQKWILSLVIVVCYVGHSWMWNNNRNIQERTQIHYFLLRHSYSETITTS